MDEEKVRGNRIEIPSQFPLKRKCESNSEAKPRQACNANFPTNHFVPPHNCHVRGKPSPNPLKPVNICYGFKTVER